MEEGDNRISGCDYAAEITGGRPVLQSLKAEFKAFLLKRLAPSPFVSHQQEKGEQLPGKAVKGMFF